MEIASALNLAALIVTVAAVFGYVNFRWLKLPHTIGLVVIALAASVAIIAIDQLIPALGLQDAVRQTLIEIDLQDSLMEGMLSFLLFAGALHVDLQTLLSRRWVVGAMATFGVLISTAIVGLASFYLFGAFGLAVPLAFCFVFGALISPTDPIAVLSILKKIHVPATVQAKIAGESLFNDGVGVVLFAILLATATGLGEGASVGAGDIAVLFVTEAFGGAALGFAAGYLAYRAIKSIDEYNLEVLITLALVMGAYALAHALHVSGPIAVVIAGLLIGNHGTRFGMSEKSRDHVEKFWGLLDEILNSALFLTIGFEVIAISIDGDMALAAAIAVPIALIARFVSVGVPVLVLARIRPFTPNVVPVLTWGGLRGGISVALALSLPTGPERDVILAATYAVVIFSIVVQGLTIEAVIRRLLPADGQPREAH